MGLLFPFLAVCIRSGETVSTRLGAHHEGRPLLHIALPIIGDRDLGANNKTMTEAASAAYQLTCEAVWRGVRFNCISLKKGAAVVVHM